MAGTVIADAVQAASTSQLVIKNGVALTPPTINDVNGTQIGTFCRAWVSFNGTGTVAIKASFNVSSITDNGTGDYTINFTNAMPDANYAPAGMNRDAGSWYGGVSISASAVPTTTALRVVSHNDSGTGSLQDSSNMNVAVFR